MLLKKVKKFIINLFEIRFLTREGGGYYDPPFKCRVPNRREIGFETYSPKDFDDSNKTNKTPTKYQQNLLSLT